MPAPDLVTAELTLTGRITTASNATFLGSIGDVVVVYKPIAGESPLWDFPHGTLAHREVAAYLVSQVFGWDVVPHPGCAQCAHPPLPTSLTRSADSRARMGAGVH